MRKIKVFTIEGCDKQFEIRELTPNQILTFLQDDSLNNFDLSNLKTVFDKKFLSVCSNMTWDDLADLGFSEIEEIWKHFQEVNSTFFDLARKTGLSGMAEMFKEAIIEDFQKSLGRMTEEKKKNKQTKESTMPSSI